MIEKYKLYIYCSNLSTSESFTLFFKSLKSIDLEDIKTTKINDLKRKDEADIYQLHLFVLKLCENR